MPVIQNGDEYRFHGNEDYSFVTRSDRSRDFARRRRFGDEEDLDDHVMSQVSLPLRMTSLSASSHRSNSPIKDYSPSSRAGRRDNLHPSASPSNRSSRLSGALRHAISVCDDLNDDDESYYNSRRMTSPHCDNNNDDDEEYVIVMQRRRKRPQSRKSQRDDLYHEMSSRAPFMEDEEDQSSFKWLNERRQDYNDKREKPSASYTMPVTQRKPDKHLEEEESALKDVSSYIAKRKQFAVEDDDVMQRLKNQKYEYRTRGPNCQFGEPDMETDNRKGNFAHAPMFIMKPRSHTVWEKMYVKFTCTIRGTPEPKVTWFHNLIAIDPSKLVPGTIRISHQFGVHTLEIFQASLKDSGTYRASAQNHKGEISSYATLIVRRYDGTKTGYYDVRSGYNLTRPTDFPDVEKLDVADTFTSKSRISKEASIDGASEATVHYSAKSVPVGDGKFESVLELKIPGTKQSLDGKQLSFESVLSDTEPTTISEITQINGGPNQPKGDVTTDVKPSVIALEVKREGDDKVEKRVSFDEKKLSVKSIVNETEPASVKAVTQITEGTTESTEHGMKDPELLKSTKDTKKEGGSSCEIESSSACAISQPNDSESAEMTLEIKKDEEVMMEKEHDDVVETCNKTESLKDTLKKEPTGKEEVEGDLANDKLIDIPRVTTEPIRSSKEKTEKD